MKKQTTAALLLFLAGGLSAQKLFPLDEKLDSLSFRVVEREGRLAVEPLVALPSPGGLVAAVRLDDADLLIDLPAERQRGKFTSRFSASLAAGGSVVFPKKGALIQPATPGQPLAWRDLTEGGIELGGDYTLTVRRSEMGWVDCSAPRPAFSLKERLPYFGAAVAGAAMVGSGLFFNNKKRDDYQNYLRLWGDEKSRAEAQPFFDSAKKNERAAQMLTVGGLAVLAADAVLFWKREMKTRKRQRTYDRFCGQKSTSMLGRPTTLPMLSDVPGGLAVGLGLQFSF